jgi:hypothetical protein
MHRGRKLDRSAMNSLGPLCRRTKLEFIHLVKKTDS